MDGLPVPDARILCPFLAVLGLDLVHELGHEGIREDQMLLHPSLHVEARVLVRVAGVFPVLGHRVLCHNQTSSANGELTIGRGSMRLRPLELSNTYTPKVIRPKDKVARLREPVHDQLAVSKQAKDIWEVEDDVPVGLVRGWCCYVCLHAGDF